MNSENYICIGKIVKEKGLKGHVCIKFNYDLKSPPPKITHIFFQEKPQSFIPQEVLEFKFVSDDFGVFLFKNIFNIEQAQKFKNQAVYILENDYKKYFIKKVQDLVGFSIISLKAYHCIVEAILDMNHIRICKTSINAKEVLLPFHPNLIKSIHVSKKEIDLTIPDGLIDIYLNKTS